MTHEEELHPAHQHHWCLVAVAVYKVLVLADRAQLHTVITDTSVIVNSAVASQEFVQSD